MENLAEKIFNEALSESNTPKVKQVKKQYREAQVAFHINSLKVVELIKANAVTK